MILLPVNWYIEPCDKIATSLPNIFNVIVKSYIIDDKYIINKT